MTPALEIIDREQATYYSAYNTLSNRYTSKETRLAARYGMTVAQMRETVAAAKRYPNVKCDENGIPIGCSVEEAFRGLDKKLYKHFGEEYRIALQAEYAKEGRECPYF